MKSKNLLRLPASAARLALGVAALVCCAQPQTLSREYVRLDGRILAIETPCTATSLSLSPSSRTVSPGGEEGNFAVNAPTATSWAVTNIVYVPPIQQPDTPWVQFIGSSSGTGCGSIRYRVRPNWYTGTTRTAQIVVNNGVHFDISQSFDTGLPQPVSVTPTNTSPACTSGTECPQRFDFVFHSNDGAYDINDTYINFSYKTGIYADGCLMEISRSDSGVWSGILFDIGGPDSQIIVGPAVVGSGGILENPQCKVDVGGADITKINATDMRLSITVSFKAVFKGRQSIFVSTSGAAIGAGISLGQWTAWSAQASAPTATISSVTEPAAPLGTGSDVNGFRYIADEYAYYGPTVANPSTVWSSPNICQVHFRRRFCNCVDLRSDDNTTVIADATGYPGYIENSQCRVEVWQTAVGLTGDGNGIFINPPIRLKPGYAGGESIFLVKDKTISANGSSTPLSSTPATATYTATHAPFVDALNGTSLCNATNPQSLIASAEDPDGVNDVKEVHLLVAPASMSSTGTTSCEVKYVIGSSTDTLWIKNSSGTWLGGFAPGSTQSQSNGVCTLYGLNSVKSLSADGKSRLITFSMDVTPRNDHYVFVQAIDAAGGNNGWQRRATCGVSTAAALVACPPDDVP